LLGDNPSRASASGSTKRLIEKIVRCEFSAAGAFGNHCKQGGVIARLSAVFKSANPSIKSGNLSTHLGAQRSDP
jgi:hypothetical protein